MYISYRNEEEITKRTRKFRSEWKQQFPWLLEKAGQCYCSVCERTLVNHLSHLKNHATKSAHVQRLEQKKNQVQLDQFFTEEQRSLDKQVMQAELTLVMFCICHNLPFLLMDFLPFLLRECCPDSRIAKLIKCGRTKATQLADTLGGKARENITSTMQSSKFSLIVDETTDVSDRKCLVLVVRYFDRISKSIKDRFLSLLELVQADAKSIYETIKAFFDKNNIPIENLIGLATDGASTMAGELNGLKTKLKRDTDFFYIKCTCHSLHLCSSYACKKLPLDVENLCRKVYNFFAHSSKRIHELKEFQEYCNSEPHKMLGLSVTRWLALEAVVSRIIEQWKPLQLYFLSCALEVNGGKPIEISNLLANEEIRVYMMFLSYILKIINNLNKEFQSETVRLPYLFQQLDINFKLVAFNYIKSSYIKIIACLNNFVTNNSENILPPLEAFIGSEAEKYLKDKNFSESQQIEIKVCCRKFYIEFLDQLKKRFDFSRTDLKSLSIITPNNIINQTKDSFLQLLNAFSYLNDYNNDTIITQWRHLTLLENDLNQADDILSFWQNISSIKNGLNEYSFKELTDFIFNLMCLPHSSAAAERKFFSLSLIKTKLRNRLEFNSLNNIMLAKELTLGNDQHYVWSAKDYFK